MYAADPDAEYARTVRMDLSTLSSIVAFPHLPENGKTFDEFGDIPIQQVVVGSCTNGRLSDLAELRKSSKAVKSPKVFAR